MRGRPRLEGTDAGTEDKDEGEGVSEGEGGDEEAFGEDEEVGGSAEEGRSLVLRFTPLQPHFSGQKLARRRVRWRNRRDKRASTIPSTRSTTGKLGKIV